MNILLSAICDWRIIMVKTPIFKGSCTAIVTPFDEHGINFDKMKELINFQYDNGTATYVKCSTSPFCVVLL